MHSRTIDVVSGPGERALPPLPSLSFERQVQSGLNLVLPLKNPAQMPALLRTVGAVMDDVHAALEGLHYPHFARFLPLPDGSALLVITTYDGQLRSYLMDFVAVMGDVFTTILGFVKDAPPLPVQEHPEQFLSFVGAHDMKQAGVWSAYPDLTLLDIRRQARGR